MDDQPSQVDVMRVAESVVREARERHLETQPGAGHTYSEHMYRKGIYQGMLTLLRVIDPQTADSLEQSFVSEGYL